MDTADRDLVAWLRMMRDHSGLAGCRPHFDRAAIKIEHLLAEIERLNALINSPQTADWLEAVPLEAAHQIDRWGAEHDTGKTAWDWFWLIGYLAQKAASSALAEDTVKAKHHTISTGAALLNWHRALTGESNVMRPGIDPTARGIE